MKVSSLKPDMVVYSVGRAKMGNTTMTRTAVWRVVIQSVDVEAGTCVASWNSNPPRKYTERDIKKWRLTRPTDNPRMAR